MTAPHASDLVVLGIDGGGTHTRAAIVDGTGRVLGIGLGGPSNLHVSGREAVRGAIADAVAAAREAAGLGAHRPMSRASDAHTPSSLAFGAHESADHEAPDHATGAHQFDAAFLGHAGVVTPRDHEEIRSIARELSLAPDATVGVDHDLRIALAGGLAGAPGIVLIAGTGSSCYGRTAEGASWRAGGWGPLLDDPGSGYWLGVRGMAAVGRGIDGRGPETSLQRRLPAALGVADAEELLRLTGPGGLTRERIAELAPVVLDAADEGDGAASAIVAEGIDELALMVSAVATRLWRGTDAVLAMTGGLTSRPSFREALELAIRRRAPGVRPVASRLPPVLGAAALALESIGALSDQVAASLEKHARI